MTESGDCIVWQSYALMAAQPSPFGYNCLPQTRPTIEAEWDAYLQNRQQRRRRHSLTAPRRIEAQVKMSNGRTAQTVACGTSTIWLIRRPTATLHST